jgi:hypothetical protein
MRIIGCYIMYTVPKAYGIPVIVARGLGIHTACWLGCLGIVVAEVTDK